MTIIRQIGEAISTIHQHNLVHCDITPDNILFDEYDQAILADFGISIQLPLYINSVQISPVRGTAHYMAPEQFEGIITRKCDQYSLGCIAYELFTGTHPIEPVTSPNIKDKKFMKEQHSDIKPEEPYIYNKNVKDFIGKATLKAIAKTPEERHEDVITFIKALHQPLHFTTAINSYTRQDPIEGPAEISTDLRLQENDFGAFLSLLDWAGFKALPDESVRSYDNRRWCTRVWEKSFESPESPSRALIYIPEGILVNPTQANRESIGYICTAFDKDKILVVVSKSSHFPDTEIQRIIDEDWKKQGIKGIILPWSRIDRLIRSKAEIESKSKGLTVKGKNISEQDVVKNDIKRLLEWSNTHKV